MQDRIAKAMYRKVEEEPFAKKLGLKLLKLGPGYSLVRMVFTKDMENIFGMAHGGAIFSLIDEAFETASNSHGTVAVALGLTVNYIASPAPGAALYAEAKEIHRSSRIGIYEIEVRDGDGNLIARSQTQVYRKKDRLPFLD